MHVEERGRGGGGEEREAPTATASCCIGDLLVDQWKKERKKEKEGGREAVWKDDRLHYHQTSDSDASACVLIYVCVLGG